MESKLVKIGTAAKMLGTTPGTLRKWESTGELLPFRKTAGGTRYYSVSDLLALETSDAPTVCYARVSSHDQKEDLERQQVMLESYCAAKGWRTETSMRQRTSETTPRQCKKIYTVSPTGFEACGERGAGWKILFQ